MQVGARQRWSRGAVLACGVMILITPVALAECRAVATPDVACGQCCLMGPPKCGCFADAGPVPVHPRLHPVPTRPVFAPLGCVDYSAMAGKMSGEPRAAGGGRSLKIEVLPPAPVPEGILNPSPPLGSEDRMTGVPSRFGGTSDRASWVFPWPSSAASGRLADRNYPGWRRLNEYRR